MNDDIKPRRQNTPIMDVQKPKVTTPPPKIPEPEPVQSHEQHVDPDVLLQQIEVEHALSSSHNPRPPYGLIIVTVFVVIVISIASWFVLQVRL